MEKTIVIQSYRTKKVPTWITRCMTGVRGWATSRGFDYVCHDDAFFKLAPNWYRRKVNNQLHLVTDYARLIAMSRALKAGYERAIWIDADVLIFDPEHFIIPTDQPYGFGLQLWLIHTKKKTEVTSYVHNAVMHFHAQNPFLRTYRELAKDTIRTTPSDELKHTAIGPTLLTKLHEQTPLPLLPDCALFSPAALQAVAEKNLSLISLLAKHHPSPITCANLCSTFNHKSTRFKVFIEDATYHAAIDHLLETKGAIFNQFVKASSLDSPVRLE